MYDQEPNVDGVVVRSTALGRGSGTVAPTGRGRTATHEVGHWLGLFHVWSKSNAQGCSADDGIADTPPQFGPTSSNVVCPSFPSISCPGAPHGDMFMNYMDLSNDACMNLFTNGQKQRMRTNFLPGGFRHAFIDNYFKIKDIDLNSCQNNTITINLQNVHCLPVTWSVNGANIVSQSDQSITLTGSGNVTLTATSGNYTDTETFYLGASLDPDFGRQFCQTFNFDLQNYITFTGNGFSPISPNFEVQVTPNSANFQYYISGNRMYIAPFTVGIISFRVRVMGVCGWSSWQLYQYSVINCGGGFFRVYPNPASEQITVEMKQDKKDKTRSQEPTEVKVELYNAHQKLLYEQKEKDLKFKVNTEKLPKGVYYLKVITKEESHTERLVIEK